MAYTFMNSLFSVFRCQTTLFQISHFA